MLWVAPGCTWVWIVHSYAFCKEPMPGSEKANPQMEQPVSGVTVCGDTPHHQLFAGCRAHAVTWHINATPGLWSAFSSTKFEGVQWTFNFVLCPLLIKAITLFFKASGLEFSDNYSQLCQFFFCVWLGWFLPHKLNCVYWYWFLTVASLPGYSLSSFHHNSHPGLDQKILDNF